MQLVGYFWTAVADLFADGVDHDEGNQFPICAPEPLSDLFTAAGLESVDTCPLDVPTVFTDFEDFWAPFLRGQGPAGAYCAALSDGDRQRLRHHLQISVPLSGDGAIEMIARAWAVRGTVAERTS